MRNCICLYDNHKCLCSPATVPFPFSSSHKQLVICLLLICCYGVAADDEKIHRVEVHVKRNNFTRFALTTHNFFHCFYSFQLNKAVDCLQLHLLSSRKAFYCFEKKEELVVLQICMSASVTKSRAAVMMQFLISLKAHKT
jgi:hypothetical protein